MVYEGVVERHIHCLYREINQKAEDTRAIYGALSYNYVITKAVSLYFSGFAPKS